MIFIFKIAIRYIFAKTNDRFISFISGFCLLGTTIGVAALIVVMAIMNGFHQELTKGIIGLNGHLIISTDNINLKNELAKYDFVQSVGQIIEGQGLLTYNGAATGVVVKGLTIDDIALKKPIINSMFGEIKDFIKPDSILIGREMAISLGLELEDRIKLIIPETIPSMFGSIPKSKEFSVVGIFSSGLSDYDLINVIIPLNTAEKMFLYKNKTLEVYTKDPDKVFGYSNIIFQDFSKDIKFINNWKIANNAILDALKVEKVAMATVLSLIVLVAAFNIVSSLFMLVKDKTKDIAILRTIGASKASIMLIFMLNGTIIGSFGTSLGVLIGQLIAKNINTIKEYLELFSGIKIFDSAIYFLYNLPADLQPRDVILVSTMSLTLSVLASLYPAYRAAKLSPIDAMRYE
jgi:lipoprotein-releasing system permease protein